MSAELGKLRQEYVDSVIKVLLELGKVSGGPIPRKKENFLFFTEEDKGRCPHETRLFRYYHRLRRETDGRSITRVYFAVTPAEKLEDGNWKHGIRYGEDLDKCPHLRDPNALLRIEKNLEMFGYRLLPAKMV